MTQYCPHTATCPFYQNWVEYHDNRIEVIMVNKKEENFPYECITLMLLNNLKRREPFPINDKLKKRLIDPERRDFECSHITLLNLLDNLLNKLDKE